MFLTFGVNQKGKWIGIDEVDSGKQPCTVLTVSSS